MKFTSELALDGHIQYEHTRDIDIVDIETFDQLNPSVRLLSGLSITDDATKREWLANLKTYIKESEGEIHESDTKETMDYKEENIENNSPITNCNICDQVFTTKWAMINHKSAVHMEEQEKPETEEITNHKLENILDTMVEKRDGKWCCRRCGKPKLDKFHVKRHAEIHLVGIVHPCAICKKAHKTRYSLKRHLLAYHST